MLRKVLALSLALALFLSCVITGGTVRAQSETLTVSDTHINPLYQDSFSESDLVFAPLPRAASGNYTDSLEVLTLQIREGMKNRQSPIMLYINMPDPQQDPLKAMIRNAFSAAIAHTGIPTEGDYLRWQYGGWNYGDGAQGYYADDGSVNWDIPFYVTYYTTSGQEAEMDSRIDEIIDELDVQDGTEYQIIRSIYDYICANVTYDYDNLEDDSYKLKHTAYAAVFHKTAVCQGYALLFYRLALELGVDARLIAGDGGGPHGWNIARIDQYYYNLDSTWDAGVTNYSWFLRCPDTFVRHTRYDEYETAEFHRVYPMAPTDYTPDACDHSYTETVTREPFCLEEGTTTHTCSKCGDSYKTTIPALGHNPVTDKGYPATCTQDGLTDGSHCGRCGAAITAQTVIPATGHSWDKGTVTREPTEEQPGIRTYTCTACRETRTEEIPPLEHTHKYTSVVTAPTCTEGGYTTYTCACGDSYVDDRTNALGHNPVTDKGYAATCTQDGLTDGSHCGRCGAAITAQTVIPATGHSWDKGTVTREPTEEQPGIRTYTCTACRETRTEEIPPLEHTHKYTSVVTAPTCTEGGYTTYTCACGDSYVDDRTNALGHAPVTDKGYAATCTQDGLTDGSHCSRCGAAITAQTVIPATGHSWDKGTVTREPTEEQPGIRTYTCTACRETRTEEIPYVKPETAITRVYGNDRCATAIDSAKKLKDLLGVEYFDTILIANGDNFADALTGSYLANVKGAPILLYRRSGAAQNQAFILENLSSNGIVYILGGTSAVPESVYEDLTAAGIRAERISGDSRFSTNLKILEKAGVQNQEILIATGWEFADSLSASATGLPVLMVNTVTGKLTDEQIAFLQAHSTNQYTIVGGTGAVSETLETLIEQYVDTAVDRVNGNSREETSVAVAERYFTNPNAVFLAYSRGFPDGLCGGPLAYASGAPLILINNRTEQSARDYIRANHIHTGFVMGGTGVVSDASVAIAFDL